jgi:hypothetical protein
MHPYVSSTGIDKSAADESNHKGMPPSVRPLKGKCVMNLKLIAAAAAALLVATPALAAQRAAHHRYSHAHARLFNYRSVYGAYGFDQGGNFAPDNISGDFDRRNTFN